MLPVVPNQRKFAIVLLVFEVILIILFALFANYGPESHARSDGSDDVEPLHKSYAMFTDIHIMVFVGFGFLMTFLKRYGYGAFGMNFLLSAFVIQWSIIVQGLLKSQFKPFDLNISTMIEGDVAAAAVLITFGALLGKVGPLQLVTIALLEVLFYSANFHFCLHWLGAIDAGGSMVVHTFGAYFGLACARVINENWHHDHFLNTAEYHSDLFALVGTVFLWVCWPSFNGALVPGLQQYRAVVNTYLALAACVVASFVATVLVTKERRFNILHIQNATLAGGVAVGTCADMMVNPFGAMVIGLLSGFLSVAGYQYISDFLAIKFKMHDTCGVNNLHGMPGILAGLAGIVAAALASTSTYANHLYDVFPARRGTHLTASGGSDRALITEDGGFGRTAGQQAGAQAGALLATLLFALIGGAITGFIIRWRCCQRLLETEGFNDGALWELPQDVDSFDNCQVTHEAPVVHQQQHHDEKDHHEHHQQQQHQQQQQQQEQQRHLENNSSGQHQTHHQPANEQIQQHQHHHHHADRQQQNTA